MDKEIIATQLTPIQIEPQVQTLIDTIRFEIDSGKERAYLAMEQEKRLTYWNVGKHIKEHLMQNEGREDYGTYLIPQLTNDLNIGRSVLYDSVQFYEEYPNIVPSKGQLTWSHIRVLLRVPEKQSRKQFEEKIVNEKLTVNELKKLLKNDKNTLKQLEKSTLKTSRGQPFTYRLSKKRGKDMVDLGFSVFIESPLQNPYTQKTGRPAKDVVRVAKGKQEYQFTNMDKGVVPYYTYKAYVIEIIDGDTIWVNIDLGFKAWTMQKLRLRGINTKGIETAEGQKAKDYIEACLNQCKFIAIKTYYRDKFTRYLADVFFIKRETNLNKVVEEGAFLNQELLDEGLAVKY